MKTSCAVLAMVCAAALWPQRGWATQPCPDTARIRAGTGVYVAPPQYFTGRGWTLSERRDSLAADTDARVCERRMVGFLTGRRAWLFITYEGGNETRSGWVFVGAVQDAALRRRWSSTPRASVPDLLLPRPAQAQDLGLPGGESATPGNLQPTLIMWIVVLLGMAAKGLYDYLMDGATGDRRRYLARILAAFIVSPLVLAGINNIGDFNLAGVEGFLAYLFIAFQNGFFWQTIMGRLGPAAKPASAGVT